MEFGITKLLLRLTFTFTGIAFLFLIATLIVGGTPEKRISSNLPDVTEDSEAADSLKGVVQETSFDDYADIFNGREIFQSVLKDSSVIQTAPVKSADYDNGFMAGEYKIVGILINQEPQAVVEKRKDRSSFFLSVGDEVDGAIVEEIHPGRVVFSSRGNRIELIAEE
ncbi:MAG: hypothetical protein AB1650_06280 [Candidatus Omnitrophota bacterium]